LDQRLPIESEPSYDGKKGDQDMIDMFKDFKEELNRQE
jgi:hypothetical protein